MFTRPGRDIAAWRNGPVIALALFIYEKVIVRRRQARSRRLVSRLPPDLARDVGLGHLSERANSMEERWRRELDLINK